MADTDDRKLERERDAHREDRETWERLGYAPAPDMDSGNPNLAWYEDDYGNLHLCYIGGHPEDCF